ncbi:MAG TPA: metallophosphoesterase family protein [Thermotogota bacterium]|nr:metallophosphoesterase family protein [Thermotogota bacterium]HRW34523.1 metallophosphoesterase family protein [Thermotogota bacterium]
MKNHKRKPLLLLLSLLLVLLALYVFFIEPNRLDITYIGSGETPAVYPVDSECRIAFFADLHLFRYRAFHERLLNTIESYHPDMILFGGDALAKLTDVHDLESFFDRLKRIGPVYTNFGNWEEYAPVHMKQRFENLGITLIEKDTVYETIKGFKIAITGLESHYFLSQTQLVDEREAPDLSVLLIHSTIGLEDKPDVIRQYDMVLAGHIHGGQYVVPYLTKKLIELRNGRDIEYYAGRYDAEDTLIYVTRGVGQWFPGRFNCSPELVIFDLMLSKDSKNAE